nr:uncharacterized protein LOC127347554 [Lolium perenne]
MTRPDLAAMNPPQAPSAAGAAPPSPAVVDVPVGEEEDPEAVLRSPCGGRSSTGCDCRSFQEGGRTKKKAVGPKGAPPSKVKTKAISHIGLAPPPPSKATAPSPSVPSAATPAPPPPSMDVDKVFDVESTTSYMDMLNDSSVDLGAGIDAFDGGWKLRDNEPKCKKEALLNMDDEAEDMSARNKGKPEGSKKAKERVKVEGKAASFKEKLDQLMKSKEALTMKTLETKLLITEKKKEVKLAKVEARREDAKVKAELDSRMLALKEAKAMKELLAEEREIMMMRTDNMDEDQLAWWKETKADIMARKMLARQARAAGASTPRGMRRRAGMRPASYCNYHASHGPSSRGAHQSGRACGRKLLQLPSLARAIKQGAQPR